MTKPVPGIKIPYFIADQYPVVEELRCIELKIPDNDAFMPLLAGLYKLACRSFNYRGADAAHRFALAEMWRNAYDANDWEQCMNCEELIECLQPLFDAINTRFDGVDGAISTLQSGFTSLQEIVQGNGATELVLPPEPLKSKTYPGALALVRAMDKKNRELYAEAEASFVDNAAEWISTILDIFPFFAAQGVNAGAEMANAYFENQVAQYEADYPDFELAAACDLMCRIDDNGEVLDYEVWGDWLFEITDLFPGGNAAANVYTKYSPLRQTFLNQIAAFFNQEASLQSYFDDLWNAYYAGTTVPVIVPPDCTCNDEWAHEFNFLTSEAGWAENTEVTGAIWTDGVGWETVDGTFVGQFFRRWDIDITWPTSAVITSVDVDYLYEKGTFFTAANAFGGIIGGTTIFDLLDSQMEDGENLIHQWTGSVTATYARFAINACRNNVEAYDGQSLVRRIIFRGTGVNPFL